MYIHILLLNAGQKQNTNINKILFENMTKLKYLGIKSENKIKDRLNLEMLVNIQFRIFINNPSPV
jgi:hypothetical protein